MTAREVYEGILIEGASQGAPDLMLDEFNYYINKAIYQYYEKRYNTYDLNQQTSDDLQVLKGSTSLEGAALNHIGDSQEIPSGATLTQALYDVTLPANYFHLLNCIVTYTLQEDFQCYNSGYQIQVAAKRLTADMYASILNNAFQKPLYKRPYYFIQSNGKKILEDWATNADYDNTTVNSHIQKEAGDEVAHNAWSDTNDDGILTAGEPFVGPVMQINYGRDNSVFSLTKVDIDYLKVPSRVRITPEQIDATADESQVMEFPEYVCREIIKEAVKLVRFREGDQRLQAHDAVETSIPPQPGATQQSPRQ